MKMTIILGQFDGQYRQDEIDAMNAKVAEVLEAHNFAKVDLSDRERAEIVRAVEGEVSGNYDPNIGWSGVVELMPAKWGRFLASRRAHHRLTFYDPRRWPTARR
jgi:hypothetical protein